MNFSVWTQMIIMLNSGEEIMFRTDLLDQPSILDEYSRVREALLFKNGWIFWIFLNGGVGSNAVRNFSGNSFIFEKTGFPVVCRKCSFWIQSYYHVPAFCTYSELGASVSHPDSWWQRSCEKWWDNLKMVRYDEMLQKMVRGFEDGEIWWDIAKNGERVWRWWDVAKNGERV